MIENPQKKRKCLKCDKLFLSRGVGNRICARCASRNARIKITPRALDLQRGKKTHNKELLPPGLDSPLS